MKKPRLSGTQLFALLLFLCACGLGIMSRRPGQSSPEAPRARWHDGNPLGGKGLHLLLGRLNFKVQRVSKRLESMPADARTWVLLDPLTGFTENEAKLLLRWIERGGTLVWALPSGYEYGSGAPNVNVAGRNGIEHLRGKLQMGNVKFNFNPPKANTPLPVLGALTPAGASIYWNGVKSASGSLHSLNVQEPYLTIASSAFGPQIVCKTYGTGRVIVLPDAMLFTNYALSKPDNAVLVTNLVRAHLPAGTPQAAGTLYFDERQHGESTAPKSQPTVIYHLAQPPFSYALLQLLGALLLVWALYGRRLGAPVPLPEQEPVTRASHFAAAMGSLFQKVRRPQVAGAISGEEFRRVLARRLGMSPADPDHELAARASELTGLPAAMIDRLLFQARTPAESEGEVLSDVQEMEIVLRSLNSH